MQEVLGQVLGIFTTNKVKVGDNRGVQHIQGHIHGILWNYLDL